MRCKAKGCQQSAEIDTLCVAHYGVTKGVTLVDAILERNRRQAAIKASQDEIVAKAQADFKTQMDMQNMKCSRCKKVIERSLGPAICDHCIEEQVKEEIAFYREEGRVYMERRIQNILHGDVSRVSAAKPKCEIEDCMRDAERGKRRCEDHEDPDDRCTESGCTNMVIPHGPGYGYGLCRDHYYERKHDKRRWLKELPAMSTLAAIVYVPMFAAGLLFGWPYIVASWGVLCAGVLGNQSELGLVQGWKRADKPRLPSKNAAKPQPFSLPNV